MVGIRAPTVHSSLAGYTTRNKKGKLLKNVSLPVLFRDNDQFANAIEKVKTSKKPIWGLLHPETREDLPGSKSVKTRLGKRPVTGLIVIS